MDKNKRSNKYLIINILISILLLSFNIGITNNALKEQPTGIAIFLGLTFIALCGYNIFTYIYSDNKKERIRLIINNVILIISSIFGFLGASNIFNFAIATFIFVLSASINSLLKIFLCKKKPNIAVTISYALIAFVLFLMSFVAFIPFDEGMQYYITLIDFFIVFIIAIKNMLLPTLKFDRMKLFILILNKTHLFDVLICLLGLIITFSYVLPIVDEGINTFWDAMWYCFSIVTTIGLGDVATKSIIGRIISVILGIYGLMVVAVFTSVIVNFYNATNIRNDDTKEGEEPKIEKNKEENETKNKENEDEKQAS